MAAAAVQNTLFEVESPSLSTIINVASVPKRSVFRYPGGKTWLVPHIRRWIRSLPRAPEIFIEPFAGGGIVGLTIAFESLAPRVLLIEKDADVAAVWRVMLGGQAAVLANRVRSFELSRKTALAVLTSRPRTLLDRAFVTLLRNRVQHGGIMAPGASLMRDGENGKGIQSRWYAETLARRIEAIAGIRDRISFQQTDAFTALQIYKHAANAAFFIDPPYMVAGRRLYRHCDVDHRQLFRLAAQVRGAVLMTYDDTPEVSRWAGEYGLQIKYVAMKSRQHTEKLEAVIGNDLAWTED